MCKHPVVILACAILASCGHSATSLSAVVSAGAVTNTPPQAAAAPRPAGARAPEPAVATTSGKTTMPAAPASDFESRMREVTARENDTDFLNAIQLCNEMGKDFQNPELLEKLAETRSRLLEAKKAAPELAFAIQSLASGDPKKAQVAQEMLDEAGELGRIFLRHALRTKPEPIAMKAGQMLAEMDDPAAFSLFLDKLKKDPGSPLGRSACQAIAVMRIEEAVPLMEQCLASGALSADARATIIVGLKKMVHKVSASTFKSVYEEMKEDKNYSHRNSVDLLTEAYAEVCDRNRSAFDKLIGVKGAGDSLEAYVTKGLLTVSDSALREWAAQQVVKCLFVRIGLHGMYYSGTNFEKLLFERLDAKIDFTEATYNFPDGRRENLSIRWKGSLVIDKPGKHTIFSAADDGQKVQIDGKWVINDWTMHGVEEKSAEVELTPGLHEIVVEHMQGGGGAAIKISWKTPGTSEKTVITGKNLVTQPWAGMPK